MCGQVHWQFNFIVKIEAMPRHDFDNPEKKLRWTEIHRRIKFATGGRYWTEPQENL